MTVALVEDNEYDLVVEALYAFREKKVAALQEAGQHAATSSFTARDFGIPQIDAILTRLDAKPPQDVVDAILANSNFKIPFKGAPEHARGNTAVLVHLDDSGHFVGPHGDRASGLNVVEIDLEREAYRAIMAEASKAKWHPPEYTGNDIDADILRWLREEYVPHAAVPPAGEIGIRMEGGVIQSVWTDRPMDVVVIDYDTEGCSADELFDMPQDDGRTSECIVQEYAADVMPEECQRIRAALDAREPEGPRP
ncbi:MAG: hypothetical protein ACREPQ_00570 [Rhodanobacter sp.]